MRYQIGPPRHLKNLLFDLSGANVHVAPGSVKYPEVKEILNELVLARQQSTSASRCCSNNLIILAKSISERLRRSPTTIAAESMRRLVDYLARVVPRPNTIYAGKAEDASLGVSELARR